ncbi:hypothetical protein S140_107 [Shewanella sp. phage 1/40]|nr:hypothetical protein S140_107 [Shewanella sp. phage 1/40]AHK11514.1 hypothetical protein S140_107 [Shewanella sp. phage 1/40]
MNPPCAGFLLPVIPIHTTSIAYCQGM